MELQDIAPGMTEFPLELLGTLFVLLFFFFLWEAVWKAMAMWRAARLGSTGWFVALLLLNTIGVVPILYLLMTREQYRKLQGDIARRNTSA